MGNLSVKARREADELAAQYLEAKARKESADADLKTVKERLEVWLTGNPPAEGENSVRLHDDLKVGWANRTVVKMPADFDEKGFAKVFPNAVSMTVNVTAVKGLLVADITREDVECFGVKLVTERSFSVTR